MPCTGWGAGLGLYVVEFIYSIYVMNTCKNPGQDKVFTTFQNTIIWSCTWLKNVKIFIIFLSLAKIYYMKAESSTPPCAGHLYLWCHAKKYIWFLLMMQRLNVMWSTEKKFLFYLNKFDDFVPINSYFSYILCPNFLFYSYILAFQIPIFIFFGGPLVLDTLV